MRLDTPRILPLSEAEWNDEQRSVLEPFVKQGRLYNIYTTLGRNPKALTAFLAWGGYVLRRTDLDPRRRELIILRIGYLCSSGYEWAQHSRLGKQAGLIESDLARIKVGAVAKEWSEEDRTLLVAADELHCNQFISDATWIRLRSFLTEEQCMDVVFVIAHYTQVCMILNTFGIQLDPDLMADASLHRQ